MQTARLFFLSMFCLIAALGRLISLTLYVARQLVVWCLSGVAWVYTGP